MNSKKLIIRHLTGQSSQREEEQIRSWLAESPRNNDLFIQFERVWSVAEPPIVTDIPDVRGEWQKLERSLGLRMDEKCRNGSIRRTRPVFATGLNIRFRPVMVFAVILIVLTAFMLWRTIIFNPQQTINTQNGRTKIIDLPDGSTIQLNTGSDIRYHKKFTKDRQVTLQGEAFFTVLPAEKPFVVTTENSKTIVLGTRFNVRSRNNRTRVTVQKGRVLFCVTDKPDSGMVLSAGQTGEIVVDNPPDGPENNNLEYYLGWLDNRLMFHKTSLTEIVGELQRYYNVTITLENVNAESLTVTGVFDSMPLEDVLSSICLTLDLQYYKAAGVYMIHN
ncbi:FecR domain-containing protein [candidate division KSB1 bacterium]|nr:FecR domain-containing protein [candidate division KSB1 bacterium]